MAKHDLSDLLDMAQEIKESQDEIKRIEGAIDELYRRLKDEFKIKSHDELVNFIDDEKESLEIDIADFQQAVAELEDRWPE